MLELHALRLVEVQLSTPLAPFADDRWEQEQPVAPAPNDTVRDHDTRRCHVCQTRHPPFGFGPPLTRPGVVIWACAAHRVEVDRMLTSGLGRPTSSEQASLF